MDTGICQQNTLPFTVELIRRVVADTFQIFDEVKMKGRGVDFIKNKNPQIFRRGDRGVGC